MTPIRSRGRWKWTRLLIAHRGVQEVDVEEGKQRNAYFSQIAGEWRQDHIDWFNRYNLLEVIKPEVTFRRVREVCNLGVR